MIGISLRRMGGFVALLFATIAGDLRAAGDASLHTAIRSAQTRVVKIYGAGGPRGLEAYQSGVLISPAGHVLTVNSYVLDAEELTVILDDGRYFKGELLGSDAVRELAVIKLPVEGEPLPCFDLADAPVAAAGDRVLAVSNLFNIATGDEPVSVLQGVVTAIAPLEARRGSYRLAFHGNVYIVDAAANNPGAAGGALVDWQGRLLGLLGKELRSGETGAWLHYALPIGEIAGAVETLREGKSAALDDQAAAAAEPMVPADLGLVLVPDVLPRTPPYIDAVAARSPAGRAGLRTDDLVVFVGGEATASCAAVIEALARHEKFDEVRVSVLRGGKLVEATLSIEAPPAENAADKVDDAVEVDSDDPPPADDPAGETDAEATD